MASPRETLPRLSVPEDLTGIRIGRFVIRAKLGTGAMGEVYRAEDTKLKRPVALKRVAPRLRSDQHYLRRFLREAEYAAQLNEPHIAAIYDVLEEYGEAFLVMEYVEGETLRQRRPRPLPLKDFLDLATQCAAALAAAHEHHIIHGDIKPENIMLTTAGVVKVLDFGVAKILPKDEPGAQSQLSTCTAVIAGTPAYMAPEVLRGEPPDSRSDLFSLGVLFYELLSGRHPFFAQSFFETYRRILEEVPPPLTQANPQIPPELQRIVAKLLEKTPADRYTNAADLLVDLHALEGYGLPEPGRVIQPLYPLRGLAMAMVVLTMIILSMIMLPAVRQRLGTWLRVTPLPADKLVAVLPLTSEGTDAQVAPFTDGLTETLTTTLTQLTSDPNLQVVPAPEIRFRKIRTLDEARKEFGATLVLEGTLHRSGDRLRINLVSVDARTRRQLRAKSLTIPVGEPFAVQDEVVEAAVAMLDLSIAPGEREMLIRHGTGVANAFDFYLQGRGYLQNYDRVENIESAIKVFGSALQLDPEYALAYAGRGDAYWLMYESSKDPQWIENSRRDCQRANTLNNHLPAAHICLAAVYKGTGQYREAAAELERAIQSEPTSDRAYMELAEAYDRLGRPEQAEATYRRAIKLRPHYWASYNWLGVFFYHRGQYDKAAEMFDQVVALAPDNARGLYNLGSARIAQGRYDDAIRVLNRSINIRPMATAFTDLGNANFYLGRFERATEAYEQAVTLTPADVLFWWNLGDGYYWTAGRRPEATSAYERAVALAKQNLKINPKDAYTLGIQAVCQAMLEEKKEALQTLQAGLQLTPGDPELLFKAALIYNHFGEIPQALVYLRRALAAGFSPTTVRDTPDFRQLRADARFQELLRAK